MEWNGCLSILQGYLENSPLIVLGSGASMPYGLPSMGTLAEEIKKSDSVISDPNYSVLCTAMDSLGLEGAIDSVALLPQTLSEIRRVVWKTVNESDLSYFDSNPTTPPQALVELLHKVLAPTPNKAVIVTTNYDRLAEYSADQTGATTVTGFEGSLIKKLEDITVVMVPDTRKALAIISSNFYGNPSKKLINGIFPLIAARCATGVKSRTS